MAKKTAKSKGYRKVAQKKPYLSKKDIVILCVLLVVLAIGAILLFSYDDGALKVKDGKIVDPGENWLIVNGNTKGGRRYFKLGEVGEISGYTMEPEPFVNDDNLHQYNYKPEAEDSAITKITLSSSPYDAARLAQANSQMIASVKDCVVSDIADGKAGDIEYTWYTYTHSYYAEDEAADEAQPEAAPAEEAAAEAPAEETAAETPAEEAATEETAAEDAPAETADDQAPNRFEQGLNAFLPAAHNGCAIVTISAEAKDADSYLTEDQLKETLEQAIAAMTLEPEKK